uniref:Kelch domain containing 1 n=1 Tax=Sparus aurata TaxID=8175 RepID=A0A671V3U7_SPAAU
MLSVYVLLQAFSLVVSLVITKLVKPLFCFFTQRRMFNMTGQVPPTMSGACGCSLKGDMYIFGGYDFSGQTNEMYCVNLTDTKYMSRKIIHESGIFLFPRIIYFGGYGEKTTDDVRSRKDCFLVEEESWIVDLIWGWNNEVHIFDPVHASWSEPRTHGQAPSARATHASAQLGHRGYIIGGKVMETSTSDIHCLDLESWTWSKIIPVSSSPVGRSWHTLTAVSDSSLFLFGGLSKDCKPMSDGWLFDVETKEWKEVEHPFKHKLRLWHTACIGTDSDVIVFGGSCEYFLEVHKVGIRDTDRHATVLD